MTRLIGYWPLHSKNGDAVDLSGFGNHGTVNGATRGIAGRGGLEAYSFDGTDDDVIMGTSAVPVGGLSTFTVSLWRNWDGGNSGTFWYSLNLSENDVFVGADGSDNPRVAYHDGNGFTTADGSSTIPQNTWVHVVGVLDGSNLILYLNGSQETSVSAGGSVRDDGTGDDAIGSGADGANYYSGQVCDVRVYDRALSANEVQAIYEQGSGDYANPPGANDGGVSYWKLDEDSGTTVADSWGTNDGSVTGATVGVDGIRDTAVSFDGTDDYISVPHDSSLDFSSEVTCTVWAKTDAWNGGRFIEKMDFDTPAGYSLQPTGTPAIRFYIGDGTDRTNASANPPVAGGWNFIAGTFDGSTIRLYYNGEVVATQAQDGIAGAGSSYDVNIGGNDSGSPVFNGDIDEARVYNRALSPAEIQELYLYGTRGRDMRKETVNKV